MAARHEEGCYDKSILLYVLVCLHRTIEILRRGGKGYRISGENTAGELVSKSPGHKILGDLLGAP